jgi:hypothetical protein
MIRQVLHKKISDGTITWKVKRQFYFRKKLIEWIFLLEVSNGNFFMSMKDLGK